jgi:stress-induced morphogen
MHPKMKSLAPLRRRIEKLLSERFNGNHDHVFVSLTALLRIHITVVSSHFEGLTSEQRDDLVWTILEGHLKDEALNRIGMCVTMTPQEAVKFMPDLVTA